jgi:hypothetical protein
MKRQDLTYETVGIYRDALRLHRGQHGLLLHRGEGPPGSTLALPERA